MKRKIMAVILAVAFMLSTAACGSSKEETRDEVFNRIEDITDKLAKCDLEGLEDCCTGRINSLGEEMPVIEEEDDEDEDGKKKKESKDDKRLKVENMIAGTITSEIDEDSFEADLFGKKCSVDVVFEYKDYQKAIKAKDKFLGVSEFQSYLNGISDKVDVEVTLEFEKKNGEFLLANANDLADVYDYEDTDLNYIDDIFDLVDSVYMTGDNWDQASDSYTDVTEFEMVFEIGKAGQEYDWVYRYKVINEDNWETLYLSGTLTAENPEEIHFTYSQDEKVPDGLYAILVYTDYSDSVQGYEFHVHTSK